MNATAPIQIASTIRTVEIPAVALKPAATTALRDFWATLDNSERAALNVNLRTIIGGIKAPESLHSAIALQVLWGSLDTLSLNARWDAFAASVRWPAIA
jgi:hypothetical protein